MSPIVDRLLDNLHPGRINTVLIGLHWTAVVAEVDGEPRCGLASTLSKPHPHGHVAVPQAGYLESLPGAALARLAYSDEPTLAGVGVAAINALSPHQSEAWVDLNAEQVLAGHGAGKSLTVIGHFPFVNRLRSSVDELMVVEQNPQPGDWPAEAAAVILPRADVVAISGTTLINHTLDRLLALCSTEALIIMLGPSTPLSPILFDHGIDILCGSLVTIVDQVLKTVEQGGNFRQVHRAGVRTVTMMRPGYNN